MKVAASQLRHALVPWLDLLSKIATIGAVIMAGIWTYHMSSITGETDSNPEIWVRTQVLPYSQNARLLIVRERERNIGKVPIDLGAGALVIKVRKVPDGLALGSIDMDHQPVAYQKSDTFKRYDGEVDLEPGVELEDMTEFVVAPGLYQVEATLALSDDYMVNDMTVQQVQ